MPSMGTDFSPIDRANEEKKGLYPAEPQVRALLREAAVGGGRRAEPCGIIPFIFFLAALLVFCSGTLFCLENLNALNLRVTKKELALDAAGEYSRALLFGAGLAVKTALEFNSRYTLRAGFGFVAAGANGSELNAFTGFRVEPFPKLPLAFAGTYFFNALPGYETNSHTLLPLVSFNGYWAGIALGLSFRFSSFYGGPLIIEPVVSFSGYVNFIHIEKLRAGIGCRNFNDFRVGNMGSYSLVMDCDVQVNETWSVNAALELIQSGSVGLSANFSGVAVRGGARFIW